MLIKLGGAVTDARGSLAGNTFSRSRSGNYVRSRKKPVNPRSPLQNTRRAWAAYLAKFWSNELTEQERTDWRAYATGTTWTNKLGETININGNAAFIRLNTMQMLIPSVVITAAPTAMGHAGGVVFTFSAESDTTKIQMNEPTGSWDTNRAIDTMWFFQGIPAEPGKISIPKGFKYIGRIWGSIGAPLVFPYEIDSAYTMRAGQLITIRGMYQDPNYRLSGPWWDTEAAAPA